jgi:hypothetical protein
MRIVSALAMSALSVLTLTLAPEAWSQQPAAAGAAEGGSAYRPTATIRQIMDAMVAPSAQVLWDAVGVEVTESGVNEKSPKTDDDWTKLRWSAVILAEATNSLKIPGRQVDQPGVGAIDEGDLTATQIAARIGKTRAAWVAFADALNATTMKMVHAIDTKNVDALSDAGGELDEVCESCHLEFWYPPQP